jgi:ADP-ribose pyrophosphatase YjhB (NUDIX family)
MAVVRSTARALVIEGGCVLCACYADGRGEWFALPGGAQRPGEDLRSALVRELREEAGLSVQVGPLRFVREVIANGAPSSALPAGVHQVEHIFACEVVGKAAGTAELDAGQSGCRWVSLAALRRSRFYPPELLAALDGPSVVYLGAGP